MKSTLYIGRTTLYAMRPGNHITMYIGKCIVNWVPRGSTMPLAESKLPLLNMFWM